MLETLTKLNTELERTMKIAKTKFPSKSFPEPKIRMDLTGKCAGICYKTEIRFNFDLMMKNKEDFINETVAHEVAHYVTYVIDRGCKPHGSTWRAVMKLFGIANPKVYHNYDVTPVKQLKSPYLYKCSCQKHYFTKIRHKRSMNGIRYYCKACKKLCVFAEEVQC